MLCLSESNEIIMLVAQAAGDVEFNDGVSRDDYKVVIDSASNCTIESLTANEIDCRPPTVAPAFHPSFRYNNVSTLDCHRNHSFHVQVSICLCLQRYAVHNKDYAVRHPSSSVCLSPSCTVLKRLNRSSRSFHHVLNQPIQFSQTHALLRSVIPMGTCFSSVSLQNKKYEMCKGVPIISWLP